MHYELDRTGYYTGFIGERVYCWGSGFSSSWTCGRTLYSADTEQGTLVGFVTGLGAALSDICYALITGYGMSFMDELILKHQIFLQIVGSIMLLAFGIYTFRSNPVKSLRPTSANRGTYLHNFYYCFFCYILQPIDNLSF